MSALAVTATPRLGPLPSVAWRWDQETDILTGGYAAGEAGGFCGTVELTSEDGAVLVLDVRGGEVCGLDIVLWPDVHASPVLAMPAACAACTLHLRAPGRPGRLAPALDLDVALRVETDLTESLYHVALDGAAAVRTVRVADRWYVDLTADGRVAGFWLTGVPHPPPLDA